MRKENSVDFILVSRIFKFLFQLYAIKKEKKNFMNFKKSINFPRIIKKLDFNEHFRKITKFYELNLTKSYTWFSEGEGPFLLEI